MRFASYLVLSLLCSWHAGKADYRSHLKKYNNMVETAYNRGPFIDSANRKYAYLGAPYCASAVSLILDRSKAYSPKIRSASSRAFITKQSIDARRVWEGKATPPKDGVVVYIRKGGGHIEFIIGQKSQYSMECFGFNTSKPGVRGSQWNGTWSGYKTVDLKKVCSPYNVFRVTHFTAVSYGKQ